IGRITSLASSLEHAVLEKRDTGIGGECHGIERYSRCDRGLLDGRKGCRVPSERFLGWRGDRDLLEILGMRASAHDGERPDGEGDWQASAQSVYTDRRGRNVHRLISCKLTTAELP